MLKRISQLSYHIISGFWIVLFGLTLFFAWTSTNIVLGDNAHFGTSTTMVSSMFIILVVSCIIILITYPRIRSVVHNIFVNHQILTASILLALVVCLQVLFVSLVHPAAGFDAGMLHFAASSRLHVLEPRVTSYYGQNQNNLPVMLVMRWLVVQTGLKSWEFFDFLTLLMVDLAALVNITSVLIIKRQALGAALYLHATWLAVFPSIIMPYTDCWCLLPASLVLLGYFVMYQSDFVLPIQGIGAVVMGVSATITYFMKPSAIIPVIAIIIISALDWLSTGLHFSKRVAVLTSVAVILIAGSAGTTYVVSQRAVDAQTYIKIDKALAIPPIHFAAMGMYGTGGYSGEQAIQMAILQTSKQKTAYSKQMIRKRLKHLGLFGYLRFLISKQGYNTADGTFGWLLEGHFFHANQKPSQRGITNQIRNYIFLYGRHIADFRFIAQVVWIVWLSIIALGWRVQDHVSWILRLSLIGGFMFLLLFEGGRSRYLIQFLPCLLLLGSLSCRPAIDAVKHTINWYQGRTESDQAKP